MNPVFSPTDVGYLRSRYSARDILIFDPCTPVFRAKVSSVPAGPTYLAIPFNTVSLGAYTDVKVGQTVIISATSDHTLNPLWEGRTAAAATSSVLSINESAFPLTTAYYITILDTYKPRTRVRSGALVDGRLPYEGQTATINNLPSAQVVISSTTGQFVLNPSIVTLDGSTVSSILYDNPNATYDVGSSTTLASTVTMPADSHNWVRLTYTLSSGVTGFMAFQLIVIPLSGSTLPTQSIDGLRLNRTWQGQHATARAYRNVTVSSVMNGTRVVIASVANLRGGSVALDPVRFIGYLTKETNSTNSTFDKSVSFEIASIWERAAQLPLNPIAIRDSATPDKWDQLNLPTTLNVANHILARYSNVPELCCLNLGTIDNTWYGGEMNVNSTSIGDAIKDLLSEINAEIIAQPSGELYLRRDLRYVSTDDRDAADTVWEITRADVASVELSTEHYERTGRMIIGTRTFNTARTPSTGAKAVAPAVTLGTSPETQTRANQLLEANLTEAELLTAAAERVSNALAVENPAYDLGAQGRPALAYLNPNCFQWVDFDLPASVITRGRQISGRHLLTGIEIEYDVSAPSHNVRLEFLPESQGGAAFVVAALTPSASSLSMVITPPMSAYGGNYPTPSSLNSVDGSIPPFSRENMGGMAPPMPADQAFEEGRLNRNNGRAFAISFAVSTPVEAGFISNADEDYTIACVGSAQIAGSGWVYTQDFRTGAGDFAIINGSLALGVGIQNTGSGMDPYTCDANIAVTWGTSTLTSWSISASSTAADGAAFRGAYYPSEAAFQDVGGLETGDYTISALASESQPDSISIQISNTLAAPGTNIITTVTFTGTGDNPFTGEPSGNIFADAFFQWQLDEDNDDEIINVAPLGSLAGLFIEGAVASPYPPPLFNESHIYEWTWVGSGNEPSFVWEDPELDWDDNEPVYLTIAIEGPGAGT